MPIAPTHLKAIATDYVSTMSSIRGRRVHRLLLREFARFDQVLRAVADNGAPALFAWAENGSAAVCQTDGRGAAAAIAAWARLDGATVTTRYDLLKDSLPVVSWTISHPGFASIGGSLTLSAAELAPEDGSRVADMLRSLGA